MMINFRNFFYFIPFALIFVLSNSCKPQIEEKATPPNIILIMADDMGFECLSAYGSASYQTPNLDKLANEGLRFDHCYSQPLCTPSRVKIMTGKYNFRNYVAFGYLDPKEKTFGNYLQEAGYSTCVAGKWQLNGISGGKIEGWDDLNRPRHFGFQEYCLWQLDRTKPEGERYANPLININGTEIPRDDDNYGPDIMYNFVEDFIDRHKTGPFFVYYPMNLVHDPFVPTPDTKAWEDVSMRYEGDTAFFKDMVTYTDKIIGKLMQKLDNSGLADNTLILFTGDNGTHRRIYSRMKDGRVIKGEKGSMTDGGTRVPLLAYWKGKSQKGVVNTDLVDFSDFLPTLLDAAGIDLPENEIFDGQSFLPQILGKETQPKDYIYMYYQPKWGRNIDGVFVRNQKYKLYGNGMFYDVENDPLEENPLAPDTPTQQIWERFENILAELPGIPETDNN